MRAMTSRDAESGSRFVRRGFVILYHAGMENVCPGCGQRHWYVGRAMAECAVCHTALPLAESDSTGQCLTFSGTAAARRDTPRRAGRFAWRARFRSKDRSTNRE